MPCNPQILIKCLWSFHRWPCCLSHQHEWDQSCDDLLVNSSVISTKTPMSTPNWFSVTHKHCKAWRDLPQIIWQEGFLFTMLFSRTKLEDCCLISFIFFFFKLEKTLDINSIIKNKLHNMWEFGVVREGNVEIGSGRESRNLLKLRMR